MADGVPITAGTGTTIATDDVVGVGHVQRVKPCHGVDGVAVDTSASNPLPVTGAVTVASLPLPSGAATSAKQDTAAAILTTIDADTGGIATSTASIDTKTPALGQAAMAASVPVAIASNQSAVPVSGTFWQATQPISAASLPLPTGAATEATMATLLTTAAFQARINTLGSKTSANSTPVVIASDQGAIPVTGTFWQATQPVSIAAAVAVTDNSGSLTIDSTQLPAALVSGRLDVNIGASSATVPVSGTFWQATQPVSIAGTIATADATALTDNGGGFSDGTSKVIPPGFLYDEVAGTALTENDIAAARINVNRAQVGVIEDGATRGRYVTVSAANALKVDGSAVTQPVSIAATVTVGGGAAHDAVAAGSPNLMGGYASAAAPTDVSADGDAVRAWMLRNGAQAVNLTAAGALIPGDATGGLNIQGPVAHDGVAAGKPLLLGAYASAAAPSNVSADADIARLWALRSGALAVNITAAGALIPGDATGGLNVHGAVAHDGVDSGNPLKVGGKARTALPTAVAASDRADLATDVFGRALVAHATPDMQISKAFNATSTQTGGAIWTPTAGKKVVITSVVIGTYGTTAARVIIWFGASADTTYTAGTDQPVVLASFAPSATVKPGLVFTPAVPVAAITADHVLRITTDAAISIDVVVHGYEV